MYNPAFKKKKRIEWIWVHSELTLNLGSKFTYERNLYDIVHEQNWKTGKPSVSDWSVSLPPALTSLYAEELAGYFHSSQSQGYRTSGSEITGNLKSTKFNSVKTLTKTSKRKLRNQVSKTFYSW